MGVDWVEEEEQERQRELRRLPRVVRKEWPRIEKEAEIRKCGKANVAGHADTMATAAVLAMAEEWEGDEADFVRGIVREYEELSAKKTSLERVGMKIHRFWQDWGNLRMACDGKSVVQVPGFQNWLDELGGLAVEGKDVLQCVGEEVEVTEWLRGAVSDLIELRKRVSQCSDPVELERRIMAVGPAKWK